MCNILRTAELIDGVLFYCGRKGQEWKMQLDRRNALTNVACNAAGTWLRIVVGVGANNVNFPFAPSTKSYWLQMSLIMSFKVKPGPDMGSLMIDLSDFMGQPQKIENLQQYGSKLLYYVGMKAPYTGMYKESFALDDFGALIDEVNPIIILIF